MVTDDLALRKMRFAPKYCTSSSPSSSSSSLLAPSHAWGEAAKLISHALASLLSPSPPRYKASTALFS